MILSHKAEKITPSSTLAISAKAKQLRAKGLDVVGFGAGEPDFDTPKHIKEAAIEAINAGFTKYTPASGIIELKEEICKKFFRDNNLTYETSQIVVSNGAKHSLTNTFMAILNPGDEVIIPAPYWLSYTQMVELADGIPVVVTTLEENSYKITIEELEKSLTAKTKAIIINSPNNPTGVIYTKNELEKIAKFAVENDLFVISDEIYEKLIYEGNEHISIASLNDEIYKRTIIINGVSKSYSMTGWRIGYTASSKEIAKLMTSMQSHAASNPNSIAQKAALAAIGGPDDCIDEMKVEFDKRRKYMVERINKMKYLTCTNPLGAFYVFINIKEIFGLKYKEELIDSAESFAKILLEEENVAVIPCTDFGFGTHIRLSYAIALKCIEKGLDRIEEFINNLK